MIDLGPVTTDICYFLQNRGYQYTDDIISIFIKLQDISEVIILCFHTHTKEILMIIIYTNLSHV